MHEWEADTASQVGTGLLFWCWYVPSEALHPRRTASTVIAALAGGRVLQYLAVLLSPSAPGRPHTG
jgi:hypothetical protein